MGIIRFIANTDDFRIGDTLKKTFKIKAYKHLM